MKRWYSPRGAKRGLWLAGLAALLWLSWAAGFTLGRAQTVATPFSILHSSPTSIDRGCSERPEARVVAHGAESLK
ncbi:MAG: hypothetical protein P9F75_11960 [Candidatus Contendobacter sp.]|nr:hypothetical protein [Candidatus Contendobacter sp.]